MNNQLPSSHFSFSRAKYDDCNLVKTQQESTGPFNWVTDQSTQSSACHINHSPYIAYNKGQGIYDVEAENELYGINRAFSKCPEHKYVPTEENRYTKQHLQNCTNESNQFLEPHYTRTKRPCNVLSGISINRFDYLCEDPQVNIHDNTFIGSNSRLAFKDQYKQTVQPQIKLNRGSVDMSTIKPYIGNTRCCPRS